MMMRPPKGKGEKKMSTGTYQVEIKVKVGSTISVIINGQATWGTVIRLHEGGVTIDLRDTGLMLFVKMIPAFAIW